MSLRSIVPLLKTDSQLSVLKKIVQYNADAISKGANDLVEVDLGLRNALEATPVKISEKGQLVLYANNRSLIYIDMTQVNYLHILNPELIWDMLTDGSYFEVADGQVPTLLAIKKAIVQLSDATKKCFGFDVSATFLETGSTPAENEKYQIRQFLNILERALNNIGADTMGEEALVAIDKIAIAQNATEMKVSRADGNSLTIEVDFSKKMHASILEKLQQQIESNL